MKALHALFSLILIASTCFLGYGPAQSDFQQIFLFGIIAFTAYGYLTFTESLSIKNIFAVGVLIRLILMFSFPNLSDDIYRFVWDGNLIELGVNPYGSTPAELMSQNVSGLSNVLLDQMNSPDYYTIYPPLTQIIFYFSTLFTDDIFRSSLVIKLFFLVAEMFTFLGILRVLQVLGKKSSLVAIYFLNPLVMVEGMGNLHFEIIMVVFLVWSIYFIFIKKSIGWGALFLALSIASKLLPLMFLPFFLFGLKGKDRLRFFGLGLMFMVIAFSPIVLGLDLQNFASSIDLYFQKFEFNGSVYYISRFIGRKVMGYNLIAYIGPILGLTTLALILKKAISQKEYSLKEFLNFAFFAFILYLFLATTVHPWYLIIPILLSVFIKWKFAIVWSFLILLTYINYSYDPYIENLWMVAIEYGVVFAFLGYEIYSNRIKS